MGGIICYRFKLTFSDPGKRVQLALSKRTGLIEESFDGAKAR